MSDQPEPNRTADACWNFSGKSCPEGSACHYPMHCDRADKIAELKAIIASMTPAQRRVLLLMSVDGSWWWKPGHIKYDMIYRINERAGMRVVEDNDERALRFTEWRPTALGMQVHALLKGQPNAS